MRKPHDILETHEPFEAFVPPATSTPVAEHLGPVVMGGMDFLAAQTPSGGNNNQGSSSSSNNQPPKNERVIPPNSSKGRSI